MGYWVELMKKYFVYCGYISADHYDSSEGPIYELKTFHSANEMLKFRLEFDKLINYKNVSNVIFTIIHGYENKLRPIKMVSSYRIEDV